MAFTHTLSCNWSRNGESLSSSAQLSAEGEENISVTVPASDTLQVDIDISMLQLQAIYILSDQDITIKTNSSSLPDDEIELVANKALQWETDGYYAVPFDEDIVSLFLVNAGASDAEFNLRALVDPTP